ncbi:phage host-nuclease inhibitor protein Gam [Bradyrhizobium yuanmingense]|uniref:host-nuclease inhibitor Gam family protein n=1 Tax=Bradyrhizobium yuanmingense TaxID=108015 RepID=UPI0035137F15
MVKAKAAAADVRIPQNRDEAAEMIAEYGKVAIEIMRIEADLNQALAGAKKTAEDLAAPFLKQAEDIYKGLHTYCAANRQQLLGNSGTKTVDFGTGTVKWRNNPPKVKITGGEDAVVELISLKKAEAVEKKDLPTAASYGNFLRVKVEIDRDAMLKNPDLARTIPGVSIPKGREMFEVEPFGAEISESAA